MKKLVYFCFAILLYSCDSAKKPVDLSLKIVAKGDLHGNGNNSPQEQILVIKSDKEWEELKEKIKQTSSITDDLNQLSVNFDQRMLMVIIDQQRNTGGHSVEIVKTEQTPSELKVSYKKTHPKGMASMVITQPYVIASTAKCNEKITFVEVENN